MPGAQWESSGHNHLDSLSPTAPDRTVVNICPRPLEACEERQRKLQTKGPGTLQQVPSWGFGTPQNQGWSMAPFPESYATLAKCVNFLCLRFLTTEMGITLPNRLPAPKTAPRRVRGLPAISKTQGKARGFLPGHEVAPSAPGPRRGDSPVRRRPGPGAVASPQGIAAPAARPWSRRGAGALGREEGRTGMRVGPCCLIPPLRRKTARAQARPGHRALPRPPHPLCVPKCRPIAVLHGAARLGLQAPPIWLRGRHYFICS